MFIQAVRRWCTQHSVKPSIIDAVLHHVERTFLAENYEVLLDSLHAFEAYCAENDAIQVWSYFHAEYVGADQ